ncbi:MAG: Ig-like domain-containing protein [Mogibacterium sp.]|nr:Ig-like domain-containing protein [Mogibacterium sp.]
MKRILALAIAVLMLGAAMSFADGTVFNMNIKSGETVNLNIFADSDYSSTVDVDSSGFDAGDFTLNMSMNHIDWLGITDTRTGYLHFKTGAGNYDLAQEIPNLRTYAISNRVAKANLVGYTFNCNQLGSWDGNTGQWKVDYNTPEGTIRTALESLGEYISVSKCDVMDDYDLGPWDDNYLSIPTGTVVQMGNSILTFEKRNMIDDLYDSVKRKDDYLNDFSKFIYNLRQNTSFSKGETNAVSLFIPAYAELSFCGSKFRTTSDIQISILSDYSSGADALQTLNDVLDSAAMETIEVSGKPVDRYSCDPDAVFDAGFGICNELLGMLADRSTVITVLADKQITCTHGSTTVSNKTAATVFKEGYSGDVYCNTCGMLIKAGHVVPKITPTIKLAYTSLKLKTKQSTTAEKVTFAAGDSIKTIKSSNTGIVKAVKSGANGIKLTAGTKTGKATVTVTLASGKSAKVTVAVQKKAVKCTGIKVTNGTSVKIKKGKTHQIKATRSPVTCVEKITYKTSNKKVATVTSKGKVKGVKKGSAKITVKCGKKTKTIKIKVN